MNVDSCETHPHTITWGSVVLVLPAGETWFQHPVDHATDVWVSHGRLDPNTSGFGPVPAPASTEGLLLTCLRSST